jgi:hypothetical protein
MQRSALPRSPLFARSADDVKGDAQRRRACSRILDVIEHRATLIALGSAAKKTSIAWRRIEVDQLQHLTIATNESTINNAAH